MDAKHQIIVEAQTHGTGSEQELLIPVVKAMADTLAANTLITADAGYHSEATFHSSKAFPSISTWCNRSCQQQKRMTGDG
ncbi:MAG: hypothetical protein ABI144_11660 [Gallionella sp.]